MQDSTDRHRTHVHYTSCALCLPSLLFAIAQGDWAVTAVVLSLASVFLHLNPTAAELSWISRSLIALATPWLLLHPSTARPHCAALIVLGSVLAGSCDECLVLTAYLSGLALHNCSVLNHRVLVIAAGVCSVLVRLTLKSVTKLDAGEADWRQLCVLTLQAFIVAVVLLMPPLRELLSTNQHVELACQWSLYIPVLAIMCSGPLFIYSIELNRYTGFNQCNHHTSSPQSIGAVKFFCVFMTVSGATTLLVALIHQLWISSVLAGSAMVLGTVIKPQIQKLQTIMKISLMVQAAALMQSWMGSDPSTDCTCNDWLGLSEAQWLVVAATHAVGATSLCESLFEHFAQSFLSFGLTCLRTGRQTPQLIALFVLVGSLLSGWINAIRTRSLLDRTEGSSIMIAANSGCVDDDDN